MTLEHPKSFKLSILFFLSLLLLFAHYAFAQYPITKVHGSFCSGAEAGFIIPAGPCSYVNWSASGAQILEQNGTYVRVKWTGTSAQISCSYYCNYQSGSSYSPWYTISSSLTPAVSITSNKNNVCSGTSITFTATPTHGGSSPYYSWRVNGGAAPGATNSRYYTTSSLSNSDTVRCIMNTSLECYTQYSATSSPLVMTITPKQVMTVAVYGPSSVCSGSMASFYALVSNGAGTLSYQWFKNGSTVGTNSQYFSTSAVVNGDNISCRVTSSDPCVQSPVTSANFTVTVTGIQTFSAGINPGEINICSGSNVTFTATSSHPASSYQWQMNDSNVPGQTDSTFTTVATTETQLKSVRVLVTTTAGCVNQTTATGSAQEILYTIKPLPNASITGPDAGCGSVALQASTGTGYSWAWKNSGGTTVGTAATYTATASGSYTVTTTLNWCSKISSAKAVNIIAIPVAPTGLSASNRTKNSFSANWGSVSGATGYRLDVSTSSTFSSFVSGYNNLAVSGTSRIVTGLSSNTQYYFRVRTEKDGCTSGNSSNGSVITLLAEPVTSAASGQTINAFTANWASVSGATSYRLDVSTSSGFSSYVSGFNNLSLTTTNKSVTGLSPGTTYYYRVRAVNANSTSGNSTTINTITLPAQPTLTASTSITSSSFRINWSAVASAISYRLDVSLNSGFTSYVSGYNNLSVSSNYRNVTGISSGTTYYFRVRAVNASGTSVNSTVGSTITITAPPVALAASNVQSSSFTANWATVSGASGYRIDVSTNSDFTSFVSGYNNLAVSGTSREITGLTEMARYYYRVRGYNASGSSGHSNTIFAVSFDMNYIQTVSVNTPGLTTTTAVENAPNGQVMVNHGFFDGLGRSIQNVSKKASPGQQDIVQPIVYDPYGREAVKYLPYVSGNDGRYKRDFRPREDANYTVAANSPQYAFYQPGGLIAKDTKPYSETIFESSPLNRVLEQGAPGQAFQPDTIDTYASPADRSVKKSYEINGSSEVLLWTYTAPTPSYALGLIDAGTAAAPVYYAANQLIKNRTKDEQRNEVIEYIDKQGRTVLKRVQAVTGTPAINDTNYASTYYIYDDFGNLVHVIPPEAVRQLATGYYQSGATVTTKINFLKRWAFRYAYDGRQRMIIKQVPGAEPVWMVYDKRDRLVMTQDGNQRVATTKYWTFTKYDALNRPVMTGITSNTNSTQAAMQSAVDSYYSTMTSAKEWFEVYDGTTTIHGYTNKSYPQETNANNYLTVTYYDNYNFRSLFTGTYTYSSDGLNKIINFGAPVTYTQPAFANEQVKGQVTGTKVKVLDGGVVGGSTWLQTVTYYDRKYRVIQTISQNLKGGMDRVSSLYDFPGKVLMTKTTHTTSTNSTTITRSMDYDQAGRLTHTWHKVDEGDNILLAKNEYNELGQLIDKKLHSTVATASNNKQSIDYRYNIRGWLMRINNADLTPDDPNEPRDHFGMNLAYNDVISGINNTPQFNGNISATKYSTNQGFDPGLKERAYKYDYDAMSRLTAATHYEKTTGWSVSGGLHEDNITYDLNTNMLSIRRKDADGSQMDNLVFDYGTGASRGNRLLSVTDSWDTQKGFKDGNTAGADYTYDANGNRITDKNKGITSITYNYMNQREKVTFSDGNYLLYTYDVAGNKLSQHVYNSYNILQKKTEYVGEFFYENDTLKYITHEEGRYNAPAGAYEYELRDHLGNNRVTFTTKEEHDEAVATMETENLVAEQSKFLRYENARRISSHLFDKTNGSAPNTTPGYAVRLNGTANEKYGLARSFAVLPGDTVKTEVYVKYIDTNSGNWTTALNTLLTQIANGTAPAGTVVDGGSYGSSTLSFPFPGVLNTSGSGGDGPKAYLNWLVFDQNFTFINGGFIRMSNAAREYGQDCMHEKLSAEIPIVTAGFVYVYISNENETPIEVYYDEFTVSQKKSPVINSTDLYPYGAPALSYQRENSLKQDRLLNGMEWQEELNYNMFDLGQRDIDPYVPVFPTIDRFAEKYHWMSPYQYAAGNPVKYVDVNGDSVWVFSRALDTPGGGSAVHTFIVAKPDENNPDGTTYYISFYESDDGKLVGTEKEAKSSKNEDGTEKRSVETTWGDNEWNTDVNWSESKLKGKELILTPEGKTDTEFISDIRKSAIDQNNAGFKYKAITTEKNCGEAGNCNSSTTTILYNSGVPLKRIKKIDPPGYNPGIGIVNKKKN